MTTMREIANEPVSLKTWLISIVIVLPILMMTGYDQAMDAKKASIVKAEQKRQKQRYLNQVQSQKNEQLQQLAALYKQGQYMTGFGLR